MSIQLYYINPNSIRHCEAPRSNLTQRFSELNEIASRSLAMTKSRHFLTFNFINFRLSLEGIGFYHYPECGEV